MTTHMIVARTSDSITTKCGQTYRPTAAGEQFTVWDDQVTCDECAHRQVRWP